MSKDRQFEPETVEKQNNINKGDKNDKRGQ